MRKNKRLEHKDSIEKLPSEDKMSEDDQVLIDQLMQGFEQMDQAIPLGNPPQVEHLRQIVVEQKRVIRSRNLFELLMFVLLAFAIIGGNTFLVMTDLTVFGMVQIVTLISAIAFLFISQLRAKKKGDVRHVK
ncbi:YxlC family protein [Paenibacillus sp. N1-5-1-14]|uniref:YxlC family protein n=1 Tax=Paenibacillus radicibacter TaxID=2972488 RepID=UPI002158BFCB|nr:YxlC family protein [Paenibacillus radicibacter]MCR8645537.1 YxlC family protein [Paenibacillus radicibacter]